MATRGIHVRAEFDPASLARLRALPGEYGRAMDREVRRELTEAGQDAVDDIRKILRMPTPAGAGYRSGGVRAALVRGTRVSIRTTGKASQTGVRIETSGAYLPASKRRMLQLYNKDKWRHPVFSSDRKRWMKAGTYQRGRPYFSKVTLPARRKFEQAVAHANDRVAKALSSRRNAA